MKKKKILVSIGSNTFFAKKDWEFVKKVLDPILSNTFFFIREYTRICPEVKFSIYFWRQFEDAVPELQENANARCVSDEWKRARGVPSLARTHLQRNALAFSRSHGTVPLRYKSGTIFRSRTVSSQLV